MSESKIGSAFVEVMAKGISKVQQDLDKIRQRLDATGKAGQATTKSIDKMGASAKKNTSIFEGFGNAMQKAAATAAKGFAVGTAAIIGFIAASDPAGMLKFQSTLAAISVQIGSIFKPLLDQVQKVLENVLDYFRKLTNEQKDNILRWVEIAGAIALGVVVFGRIIALINLASVAMTAFGVTTGVATGGISTAIGIIAALVGSLGLLAVTTESGRGILSEFGDALKPVIAVLSELADSVKKVFLGAFAQIKPILMQSLGTVLGVFSNLVNQFKPVLAILSQNFATGLKLIMDLFKAFQPMMASTMRLMQSLFSLVMPVITANLIIFGNVLKSLSPIFTLVAGVVGTFYSMINDSFTKIINVVKPIVEEIINIIVEISALATDVISTIVPIIAAIIESLMEVAKGFSDAFGDVVVAAIKGCLVVVKFVLAAIKATVQAIRDVIAAARSLYEQIPNRVWKVVFGGDKPKLGTGGTGSSPEEHKFADETNVGGAKGSAGVGKKAAGETKKSENNHSGQAIRKVEMTAISDVWKKAMQSTNATVEQAKLNEIARTNEDAVKEAKKSNELLAEIAGGGGRKMGGGMGL